MDRTEITAYLRQLPDLIEESLHGLSDDELRHRPSPDEWSALEVCCHLRDSAQEEGVRVRRLHTALRAFWGGLAYQLEGLSDEQWERGGTHPEIGPVTVRSRAEDEVEHAQAHLEQLRAIRDQM